MSIIILVEEMEMREIHNYNKQFSGKETGANLEIGRGNFC